jgi:hypothetical protein
MAGQGCCRARQNLMPICMPMDERSCTTAREPKLRRTSHGRALKLPNHGADMRDAFAGIDVIEHGIAPSIIVRTMVLSAVLFRDGFEDD